MSETDIRTEPTHTPQLHILAAIVENKFGVLARITGLFSRRGFNIVSLAVAPTDDPGYSRVTIVVDVDDTNVSQIAKQLNKLINVIQITELEPEHSVEQELMLARIETGDRSAVEEVLSQFDGNVLDADENELIVSATGSPEQIEQCAALLRPLGIRVLQRTGRIALRRLSESEPPVAIDS